MSTTLFHVTPRAAWDPDAEEHRPEGFAREGFVHLAAEEQVAGVLERYFAGASDLLLVELDPTGLDVRWEPGAGSDPGPFPHLYAPIPRAAVVGVAPL